MAGSGNSFLTRLLLLQPNASRFASTMASRHQVLVFQLVLGKMPAAEDRRAGVGQAAELLFWPVQVRIIPCYQTNTLYLGLELQENHSECHISGVRKEEKNPCQVLHIGRENEAFCSHPERIDVFNKAVRCCILIPLRFQKQLSGRGRKQDWLALVTHCCWPQSSKTWHRASHGRHWRPVQSTESTWRASESGELVTDSFWEAEFHFTLKREDTWKLSTSLLPLQSTL